MSVPTSVLALDAAVRRLIHDSDARSAFLADAASLGTDARTAALVDAVDRADLARLGRAVVRGVASGTLCGTDLEASFPRTLAAIGADPETTYLAKIGQRPRVVVTVNGHDVELDLTDKLTTTR